MSRAVRKGDSMADGYLNFDTKINEEGFNEGISKLGSLGKTGLKAVTKSLAAVGTAVGTGIAASVKVGAAFEAEMAKVSAISGATCDDLQALTDKAKEMGAKTKFSASESAQAMEYMAMAGWKTNDMLSGIEGIMNLAAASGEDLATTSDIVTDALTAFGLSAGDSTHFADVLAQASSNANTNVGMLGETFKYVAPVAGAMGYSVEDCATAIGLMANSGIKAGQAGTSLRAILSRMAKPTDEVQMSMDKLGVSLTDTSGNVKSLDAVMGDLREGFKGLSKAEQVQLASSLAGQEAMSGLLAIVNTSDGDFDKLKDSIYNADGASAEMAATMQDNLIGQITILKSGLEGLGISIFESVETPLKNLASVAVVALDDLNTAYAQNGFAGFIEEIGEKVPFLQGFTDAIAQMAEKVKGMDSNQLMDLGKTAAVLVGAVPALSLFGTQIGNVKTAVDGMSGIATGVLSEVSKIPGGFKKTTSAVGGFAKDIESKVKSLGSGTINTFRKVGTNISSSVSTVGSFVSGKVPGVAKAFSTIGDAASGIGSAVAGVPGKVGGAIANVGSSIASKMPGVTKAISSIGDAAGKVGSVVAPKMEKVTQAFATVGKGVGKFGLSVTSGIGSALKGVLGIVAGFIPSFIGLLNFGIVAGVVVVGLGLVYSQFGEQIDKLLLMAMTKGPEIITNLGNGITSALPGLISQGATLIIFLIGAITANIPAVITVGANIISTLVSGLAEQLPRLVPAAFDMIITLVESLIDNLPQIISSGLKLMEGLAQGIANSIPKVAAKAPEIISKLISSIVSLLPQILQTGFKIIVQLAAGLINGIPTLLSKVPSMISQIKNAFTNVDWGNVGINIIKGIASGIGGAVGHLVSAATSAASSALDAIKSKLGIHSPSRVFRDQVGKMMALGMGIGFERNIPIKSMTDGVQRAVAGLQKSVDVALSAKTTGNTVGGVKNAPGFENSSIDYDKLEKIQLKAAEKMAKRPIFLGTRRIDESLPEGAVPVW